jgi:NAD(P)-dependent dehydrogenase (short-subunit alcohol dehydrogenase family)
MKSPTLSNLGTDTDASPQSVPSLDEIARCTSVLESIVSDDTILARIPADARNRLMKAVGQVTMPDRKSIRRLRREQRRLEKEALRNADRSSRETTTLRTVRRSAFFVAPQRLIGDLATHSERKLEIPDTCYICKAEFTLMHHFYDSLCPVCAALNYEKRFQTAPLDGQVAVITGARLKIGYQAALMMLRAGARVIVTTRFPKDAAMRYAKEADFPVWRERLQIYGLDLRHSPSVEIFARYLESTTDRLDILINNAAQTVRRPPGFYAHLMAFEEIPFGDLADDARSVLADYERCTIRLGHTEIDPEIEAGTGWIAEWHKQKLPTPIGVIAAAQLSQIPYTCDETGVRDSELFPVGRLDADLQQVDLRRMNSWRMTLADVPTAELIEVQLVNAIAPFVLCAKLKPLMLRQKTGQKHIVNVSAMEGKFTRYTKTDKHPHTNMAKASLNMMTLTSARDYAQDGIFMNAVDTGWVTDEDPAEITARKQRDYDFQPPLDIVDGAARIMDPVFSGINTGNHVWGNFLKDYLPTEW